jgi:alkaline phosphatase D
MSDMHHESGRRRLLQLAGAAAATLWLPRSAWTQPKLAANPFAFGVASGTPDHSSVVLWTRLQLPEAASSNAAAITVRWEIANDEAFTRIAAQGQSPALAQLAHSVHVEAPGLEPDRWYFYRFMLGEAVSPVGRTRTLPAPDAPMAMLRLAYASCQRWEHGFFSAWRHLREQSPDLVLFLGDYIYEYPGAASAPRTIEGGFVSTLEGYRDRYAQYKTDPDLRRMHEACPWFMTWDDHEVQNDYAGDEPGHSGPLVSDPRARRVAAYQAYYEHMPLRMSALTQGLAGLASGAQTRVYAHHRIGTLADLYLLDTRQYRNRQVCNPGGRHGSSTFDVSTCLEWDDPKRTLLGAAQEQWLDERFASARPGWNVLGQPTLFGQRDFMPGPERMMWNDGWDGYSAARKRFTQSLAQHRVPNVAMLGGDVHENWVGHVKADYDRPDSATLGVEFCGTSITSRSSLTAQQAATVLAENPHFIYGEPRWRGYGLAEITPQRMNVTLRGVENADKADSGIRTLANFSVQAGESRIERA